MNFFDSLIGEIAACVENHRAERYAYDSGKAWDEETYSRVIMQRDTFCELDGTGFNLVTSSHVDDEVVVVGDDIGKLSGKRKFARVCIVEIQDNSDEQKDYNLIRKIEYIKYHFFPAGYMLRTASRSHKEGVRASKAAVKNGISFEKIGNLLIKKYKENPAVKGVRVYFITDTEADFGKIDTAAQKSNSITETLNHIMSSVRFDCDTCNLKPVCDEVEGMKELHFRNASMGV